MVVVGAETVAVAMVVVVVAAVDLVVAEVAAAHLMLMGN